MRPPGSYHVAQLGVDDLLQNFGDESDRCEGVGNRHIPTDRHCVLGKCYRIVSPTAEGWKLVVVTAGKQIYEGSLKAVEQRSTHTIGFRCHSTDDPRILGLSLLC